MGSFPPPVLPQKPKTGSERLRDVWPLFAKDPFGWLLLSGAHFVLMAAFGLWAWSYTVPKGVPEGYFYFAGLSLAFDYVSFHVWLGFAMAKALNAIDGRRKPLDVAQVLLLVFSGLFNAGAVALGYICCYAPGLWMEGFAAGSPGHIRDEKPPYSFEEAGAYWMRGLVVHALDAFLIMATAVGFVGYIFAAPLYALARAALYRGDHPLEPNLVPRPL